MCLSHPQIVNQFVVRSAKFINHFSNVCEQKLQTVDDKLRRTEIVLTLLETKLKSISWLQQEGAPAPVQSSASAAPATTAAPDAPPAPPAPDAAPAAPAQPAAAVTPAADVSLATLTIVSQLFLVLKKHSCLVLLQGAAPPAAAAATPAAGSAAGWILMQSAIALSANCRCRLFVVVGGRIVDSG